MRAHNQRNPIPRYTKTVAGKPDETHMEKKLLPRRFLMKPASSASTLKMPKILFFCLIFAQNSLKNFEISFKFPAGVRSCYLTL